MADPVAASTAASDEAIIAAVRGGEVDRYAELVMRYQVVARRVAFSLLGNDADAEDAAQEAFISAYRVLGQFDGRSKFSTWLYRIVVNKCKDLYRRRQHEPRIAAYLGERDPEAGGTVLFVDVEDPAGDPGARAQQQELAVRLSQAIESLPLKQRTAFSLHHLHGLPLEEVAAVMRCRIGTVKSHVFRATTQLQRIMSPWLTGGV